MITIIIKYPEAGSKDPANNGGANSQASGAGKIQSSLGEDQVFEGGSREAPKRLVLSGLRTGLDGWLKPGELEGGMAKEGNFGIKAEQPRTGVERFLEVSRVKTTR